ncbi:8-oxoguanine deaminase [bacterium]|nr:MAG: 8-oxoguanine deaminase [bacterium]
MILLKNCYYIATFDDSDNELQGYDILIKNNVIEKIGKNIELSPDETESAEIIDCSRYLVVPGMVNTHHHLYQILTRNLPGAQNAKLFDWLTYLYPIWAKITPEAVYYSTILGTAELLKTGATTTTDHHYLYPKGFGGDIMSIQFDAAQKVGIRFSPSRGSMTRGQSSGGLPPDSVVQKTEDVVRDMQRVIEQFHDDSPFSMMRIVLAPCSPFSVDECLMRETAALARQYGVVMHTHLAETQDEEQYCIEQYGMRPLALMEKLDWLGGDVYFAHGIWFDDDELRILAETDTGISHCPTSNMRLGSGIARIKEMLELGVRVSLGVDGSASNDTSDMLGEARNALLLQRVRYGADAISARQVLKLATIGGANMLGYNKIGKIAKGFAADLALFDMFGIQHAGGLSDPLATLVFTGYNHETAYTIVNGEIVVENGKLVAFDEEEIASKVNEISKKLLE